MQNQYKGHRAYLAALMQKHSDADITKLHFRSDSQSTMIALIAAINIAHLEGGCKPTKICTMLELPVSDVECAIRLHPVLFKQNGFDYASIYNAMAEDPMEGPEDED